MLHAADFDHDDDDDARTPKKVEISGEDDEEEEEGVPQRLTVGIDDLVRVMPWFCIEVRHSRKP